MHDIIEKEINLVLPKYPECKNVELSPLLYLAS